MANGSRQAGSRSLRWPLVVVLLLFLILASHFPAVGFGPLKPCPVPFTTGRVTLWFAGCQHLAPMPFTATFVIVDMGSASPWIQMLGDTLTHPLPSPPFSPPHPLRGGSVFALPWLRHSYEWNTLPFSLFFSFLIATVGPYGDIKQGRNLGRNRIAGFLGRGGAGFFFLFVFCRAENKIHLNSVSRNLQFRPPALIL